LILRNFDTETATIIPGNLTPPLVCLTWTERQGSELTRNILSPRDGVEWFRAQLEDRDVAIGGHNVTFDLAVMVASEAERYQFELMALVFRALAEGRISCTMMRESLLLLALGVLSSDPREGNKKPLTNLGACAKRRLGLDISADKKNPDAWRLRYSELLGIPIDLWPEDAVRYAVDDPRISMLIYENQQAEAERDGYTDPDQPWLIVDEGRKIAAAWALHLCSAWGMRTDPERVATTTARIELASQAVESLLLSTGLGEAKTKQGKPYVGQKRKKVQERVAGVYAGLGIDSARLRLLTEGDGEDEESEGEDEEDSGDLTPEQGRILEAIVKDPSNVDLPLVAAISNQLEPYPLVRFAWRDAKTDEEKELAGQHLGMICLDRTGQEFTLPFSKETGVIAGKCEGQVISKIDPAGGGTSYRDKRTGAIVTPLTPPSKSFPEGQVSWGRAVLEESGDPVLLILAALGRVTKLRTTYVPQLIHGTIHPIQPRYWIPKESGRTSCSGPNVQNLPAFGGIRECFVARDGWAILAADIDQAECVAWAQWCLETFGFSRMAEILREGRDPHLWTAIHFPQLAGVSYEQASAWKKDGPGVIDRCGIPRHVLDQAQTWALDEITLRQCSILDLHLCPYLHSFMSSRDTSGCVSSEHMTHLSDEDARFVVGYLVVKVMRQYAKSPGVFGWMGGMGAPTLAKAARGYGVETTVEQAQEVIDVLNDTFPEGRKAGRWVGDRCSGDSTFTFTQRVSGRRRGGCNYTAGRNQPFQGGIADLAGDVLFHVATECYTGMMPGVREEQCRIAQSVLELWPGDIAHEAVEVVAGRLSPLYGARPWAFEHDGFLYECPYDAWGPGRATLAAKRLETIISTRGAFWFPDVPIRSTAAYARRWIKDRKTGREIKPVYDTDGYLAPME